MPQCRKCGAPIFFLSEKPEYYNAGTFQTPRQAVTEPTPIPLDIDPDPVRGYVAIYEIPSRNSVVMNERDWKGKRLTFARKLYGLALKKYVALGGVVYRCHFDTCRPGGSRR